TEPAGIDPQVLADLDAVMKRISDGAAVDPETNRLILARRQLLDHDLLEFHHGAGIVALQGEVPLLGAVLGVLPIQRRLAVYVDLGLDAIAEVFVVAALAEKVAGWPAADENALIDAPERHLLAVFQLAVVALDLAVLLLLDHLNDAPLVRRGMQLPAGEVL